MDEFIGQVWENKHNGQKLLTIPLKIDIKPGDFVSVKKVEAQQNEG